MTCVGGINETVGQVLVAALGNAQARALDDRVRPFADILDEQLLRVEATRIPVRYFQAQRFAQQCLPGAQTFGGAGLVEAAWVVALHCRQGIGAADGVDPGMRGLDQVRSIIPVRFDLAGA